ncbi:GspH/FimT family pseudopilin [Desulforegula conservatrix]|uniref:GspH/FimT family pseudopilin n=1 Tax=Desulforegula conservatrix TaxID=153026 RepID=UPI00041E9DBF|nr:GspH/FimT family pseudopilin [Desulforegula conservatrix]
MDNYDGFSLFELLVVISIIAIMSCVAVPNFVSWRNSAIVRSSAFNIKADLERARIQAMCRKFIVRVDFFQDGYRAFHDFNNNGEMDDGEEVFEKKLEGASIDSTETRFGSRSYARFSPRGMLTSDTTAGGRILVRLGGREQAMAVSRAGRIRFI